MQKCKLIKDTGMQPMTVTCPALAISQAKWAILPLVPNQNCAFLRAPQGRHQPLTSCTHPSLSLPHRNKANPLAKPCWPQSHEPQ